MPPWRLPVRDLAEVVNDPHMHQRGALQWQQHPELGRIPVQHSPLRFDGVDLMQLTPSARLGQHNADVYGGELGLSDRELELLKKEGVI